MIQMLFNDKIKLIGNVFQMVKPSIFKGKSGKVYKMEDRGSHLIARLHIDGKEEHHG